MRRHRRRNRRQKKQNRLLIISMSIVLIFMTAGYAAFNTQINVNVKGNVMKNTAAKQLLKKVVDNGDGLYVDTYETGRYVYRGQNPNNFISFNDELWRIISVESDGTLKIIKRTSLGTAVWDSEDNRNNDNNTFCNRETSASGETRYWGCNVWAKINGDYTNGVYTGTVNTDASLNTLLNNDYYNNLNEDKKYITNHLFYIGTINGDNSQILDIYNMEKGTSWTGLIGLVNVSDFLKSSTNSNCTSFSNSRDETNAPCTLENGNYLDEIKAETWTINGGFFSEIERAVSSSQVATISAYFGDVKGGVSGYYSFYNYYQVRPVVFLTENITLSGEGTETEPYVIN